MNFLWLLTTLETDAGLQASGEHDMFLQLTNLPRFFIMHVGSSQIGSYRSDAGIPRAYEFGEASVGKAAGRICVDCTIQQTVYYPSHPCSTRIESSDLTCDDNDRYIIYRIVIPNSNYRVMRNTEQRRRGGKHGYLGSAVLIGLHREIPPPTPWCNAHRTAKSCHGGRSGQFYFVGDEADGPTKMC